MFHLPAFRFLLITLCLSQFLQAQIELLNTASTQRGVRRSTYTIDNFDPKAGSDKLVVAVNAEGRDAVRTISGIRFGNRGLTRAHTGASPFGPSRRSEIWFLDDPGSQPATITIQWSGQTNGCMAGAYSLRHTKPGQPAVKADDRGKRLAVDVTAPSFMITSFVDDDEGNVLIPTSPYDVLVSGDTRSAKGAIASSLVSEPGTTEVVFFATDTNSASVTMVGIEWDGTPNTVVTTLEDQLDEPAGDEISLREALRDTFSTGTILFAPELNGGTIQLDSTLGPLVVTETLSIDASALPDSIIIDGGSNGDFVRDANETQCFIIDSPRPGIRNVRLTNLIIQNGISDQEHGGGNILNRERLTLTDCRILNGRTFSETIAVPGGGISGDGGTLGLIGCEISGNQTSGPNSPGGGVSTDNATIGRAEDFTECLISNNATFGPNSPGGGISGQQGGTSPFNLTRCTVSENQTFGEDSGGGGINASTKTLNLTACTIVNNQTHGLRSDGGGILRLSNNPFITCTFSRSTITGNAALQSQAGVMRARGGETFIDHCTMVDNTAAPGEPAGIVSFEGRTTTELTNSIVRNSNGAVDLMREENPNRFIEETTFMFSGTNIIGSIGPNIENITVNTEPLLLAPLANYGGLTDTMPPLPGSPVIDAATRSDDIVDQRNYPIVSIPDIGATELVGGNSSVLFVAKPDAFFPANPVDGEEVIWNFEQENQTEGLIFGINAFNNIQAAINAADADDFILIDEGNYIAGETILIEKDLTLIGEDRSTTRLLREETADPHSVITSRANVTIQNVTISGGQSDVRRRGGGIDAQETLTVRNSIIENNSASGTESGGGIGGDRATIIVDLCLVRGNRCHSSRSGGGIGGRSTNIMVLNSVIYDNEASAETSGGGVGGDNPVITVTDSLIRNNTSTAIDSGGGIGGIRPIITAINTTITGNEATEFRSGGGIGGLNPTVTVIHCTISGNIASGRRVSSGGSSGGIGDRTFNNAIIVTNSIVAGNVNTDSQNSEEDILGTLTDNGGNIIGIPAGLSIDDILLPLADNGGPTETFALAPDSPAINIGLNNVPGDITTDQRGEDFPRIINNIADSGAVEANTKIVLDPNDDSDADGLPLVLELALGTEPNVPSFGDTRLPFIGFAENGTDIEFSFGRGTHPFLDTILIIEFSTNLQDDSFIELFRFDFNTETSTPAPGVDANINVTAEDFSTIIPSSETGFFRVKTLLPE